MNLSSVSHLVCSQGIQPAHPQARRIMGALQTALHSTKSHADSPASASLLCCAVGVGELAWSDGIG